MRAKRFWYPKEKKMIYDCVVTINQSDGRVIGYRIHYWEYDPKTDSLKHTELDSVKDKLIDMDSVGFPDKNGTEIFHSDNVKYKGCIFEIIWCNGGFKMMEMKSGLEGACDGWINEILAGCWCGKKVESLEKIGNKFEDPELEKPEEERSNE